jgi:hypothetical protein
MATTPYDNRPDYAYWRLAVSGRSDAELDPVVSTPFRLTRNDKIVSAGSCFAEHIGRHLKAAGCAYLITEPAHTIASPEAAQATSYERFSARYGNIYTARQLLQLFDRAYGRFAPVEDVWQESEDVFLDPFRPNIQPGGFNSFREFSLDRQQHFAAVRRAFEALDIFVFTLGLTECWRSRLDGAVFPLCPGVRGGIFSAQLHEFVNYEVEDVVDDMKGFIARLRGVNPKAKVILTVSPVPLAATAEDRHVLVSTVYSKSVLRVASERLARQIENVCYFPAYEMITRPNGACFEADGRSVAEAGVAQVMRVFFSHFLTESPAAETGKTLKELRQRIFGRSRADIAGLETAFQVMCDEEALLLPRSSQDRKALIDIEMDCEISKSTGPASK